ncbi:sensor histidine kinase [Mediterraneibacter faecis]|uniref:sensor histidine kinase n=1 Tax=Mediterraneibacter faecis TaxID=592978 RepID=UPI00095F7387|nr:histidine kinase [Mediterraneibacter faecis]OKZ61794.1 MAG: two-component sensor histidine kinase [Clostridiales bacterium 41_12_two_minus]
MNHRSKKLKSLNGRIAIIAIAALLPMLCAVFYLLSVLLHFESEYDKITKSVTYANQYSKDFKERMDYSMYLAVIANKTVEELGDETTTINGIKTVNPYDYMDELEGACDDLSKIATASINRTQIVFVKNSLISLRKSVDKLFEMIQTGGAYTDKMDFLDKNIRGEGGLTDVIQTAIQNYVYEETKNYEIAKKNLEEQVEAAIKVSVMTTVVAVLLSALLSGLAVESVTKPIRKLCSQTKKVAQGDFTTQTKIESTDEILILTDSFNEMTSEIGLLVDNIKRQEENLRITETKLLQAQINPHFLYNTLDTIVWLAEAKQTDEVVSMVTALSSFFRTTLSKGKDYITIQEEKSHIESYLQIQQFRYQDIMDYEIDIDEDIYSYYIPKLTIQPLVENALYHGIKNKRGKGLIRISGQKEADRIRLTVEDNGIGMSSEKLEKLRSSVYRIRDDEANGFGLANVHQRLQYYYGKEYGVFFESEEGKGTVATIVIGTEIEK